MNIAPRPPQQGLNSRLEHGQSAGAGFHISPPPFLVPPPSLPTAKPWGLCEATESKEPWTTSKSTELNSARKDKKRELHCNLLYQMLSVSSEGFCISVCLFLCMAGCLRRPFLPSNKWECWLRQISLCFSRKAFQNWGFLRKPFSLYSVERFFFLLLEITLEWLFFPLFAEGAFSFPLTAC